MDSEIENDKNPVPKKVDQRETVGEMIQRKFHRESLFDGDSDDSEDLDDEDHMMPGLLNEGASYTIQDVLVQGWVSKKGTGQDLFASRAWKTRWAVLSVSILTILICSAVFLMCAKHDSCSLMISLHVLQGKMLTFQCYRFTGVNRPPHHRLSLF